MGWRSGSARRAPRTGTGEQAVVHAAALFITGIIVVLLGAEFIVRGASRLAALLGVRPMLIGLTVVAVGTSTPELAVGITAAIEGRGALMVGNVAGANLLDILLILGLSAMIRPLPLQMLSVKVDLPVMIAASVALFAMGWDGVLSRLEGAVLSAAALAYTVALVRVSRLEAPAMKREFSREFGFAVALRRVVGPGRHAVLLVVGVALAVSGAGLMVSGAVGIAQALGVSEAVIGLTIVAVGTTAPELATTVIATLRNERDVAVGNLIGSCIYNVLLVVGLAGLFAPAGVEVSREILRFDLPLSIAAALLCLLVFMTRRVMSRREGAIFAALYLAYLGWLVLVRA